MAQLRKKIKQEIKTEPIEQVWMDQDVSNMGKEFSRPVQTIKQEPIAMDTYIAGDFDNPSNADNENDHKETGGDEDTNEDNSGFLILPNGKVQCPNCQKSLSNMGNAKIHYQQAEPSLEGGQGGRLPPYFFRIYYIGALNLENFKKSYY